MIEGGPAGWRDKLETTAAVAWVVFLTVAAIVGGSLAHSWAAPKDALCNSYGGVAAQQGDNGVLAHCGIDGFLAQMSEVVRDLGIAMAVIIGVFLLWMLVLSRRGVSRAG